MSRTLFVITRCYTPRGQNDEFVSFWGFRSELEDQQLQIGDQTIVFIHGYSERFPNVFDPAKLVHSIQAEISVYPISGNILGLMAHTAQVVDNELAAEFKDFAFAQSYSSAQLALWDKCQALRQTYTGGKKPAIKDEAAFIACFDALWRHFSPDVPLKDWFEARHRAFSETTWSPHAVKPNNQTSQYLVIWNTWSCDWFCEKLDAFLNARKNVTRSYFIEKVTSQKTFDTIDWNKPWEKVFVLAELYWRDMDYEGCEKLLDIMRLRGDSKLNIVLYSTQERKVILDHQTGRFKLLVRSFPPLRLPENCTDDPDIKEAFARTMSEDRWCYKRRELMSDREILATLLHDLRKISTSDKNYAEDIRRCLEMLTQLEVLHDSDVKLRKLALESLISEPELNLLRTEQSKSELIACLETRQDKLQHKNDAQLPTRKQANILIVEDRPAMADKVKALFEPFFTGVEVLTSGLAAQKELETNGAEYAALITDLELLDHDGFEQVQQGVDLLRICRDSYPNIALRIVTNLRRNSIPLRVPEFASDKIIFKGDLGEREAPYWFAEFIEKLHREIDFSEKLRNLQGPKLGKFGPPGKKPSPYLTRYYYVLKEEIRDIFDKELAQILHKAQNFIAGNTPDYDLPNTEFAKTSDESLDAWGPLLWDLLLLRLIVIGKDIIAGERNEITFINYDDETGLYFDLGLDKGQTPNQEVGRRPRASRLFTTLLGFSTNIMDSGPRDIIRLREIEATCFPHEKKWIDDFDLNAYKLLGREWPGLWELIRNDLHSLAQVYSSTHQVYKVVKPLAEEISAKTSFTRFSDMLTSIRQIAEDRTVKAFLRDIALKISMAEKDSIEEFYLTRDIRQLLAL